MKKIKLYLSVAIITLSLASCSISGPLLVTDNSSEKVGEASYSVIFGILRPMDADISIKTAAKNGGITEVATVDMKVTASLFKTTYTTIVTGK